MAWPRRDPRSRSSLDLPLRLAAALGAASLVAAPGPGLALAPAGELPTPVAFPSPEPSPAVPELPLAPVLPPPEPPLPPLVRLEPLVPTWLDESHSFLERTVFWPFVRVDRFFSDERAVDAELATSYLRWRNDLRVSGTGTLDYQTAVRADLRFPFLERRLDRLRLTVAGQTSEALDRILPGDAPLAGPSGQVAAGLGLTLLETLRSQSDAGLGVLFGWPLGWYARLRLRHAQQLGDVGLGRLALAGFWQTNTGWGTRGELSVERLTLPWLVTRLAGTSTLTEKSRGVEWGGELALLATVGPSTALGLAGGASGASQAGPFVEIWQVTARARRDVLRRWLFLELVPQVDWTHQPGGSRRRTELVLLRVEVQFQETRRSRDG
jgi:hypothetical protein